MLESFCTGIFLRKVVLLVCTSKPSDQITCNLNTAYFLVCQKFHIPGPTDKAILNADCVFDTLSKMA